ncbi:MAG: hypothetical protein HWE25_09250 [Alphaproteobacteria bacterium]|nr:hypothetical protein [Alphaproteobacteria bacterium]
MTSKTGSMFAAATISLSLAFGASGAANATYNYFDVMADPGSYSGISLGESFSLDACGSTFHRADGSSESYSLCQLSDLTEFSLSWLAWHDGDYSWLGSYSGGSASDGLSVATATGDGTFFNEIGTYYVGLYVKADNNSYVPLPGGGWGATGGDGGLAYDGSTNYSFAWSSSFQVTEAMNVPEPIGALLLLPGFVYIARRERKRKQAVAA